MVAGRLQHLVLIVGDRGKSKHLVQYVKLGVRPFLCLFLLQDKLSLALQTLLVKALCSHPMWHHASGLVTYHRGRHVPKLI